MKISIVTVTYNSEDFLKDCIESVIGQTHKDIEYIIIDGDSSDNTVKIIEQYNDKISKWVSEPDKGIYDAMNNGISLATGEVIGILNSDDIYTDNEVISEIMEHFINDSELDILYGDITYVKKNDLNNIVRKWVSVSYFDDFFEEANVPPHPALFVRSRVYEKAGLFDLNYKFAGDYEFMLRIFKKHKFKSKYISRWIVKMRLGGASNQSLKNILNANKEVLTAWKKNGLKIPVKLIPLRVIKRLAQFF